MAAELSLGRFYRKRRTEQPRRSRLDLENHFTMPSKKKKPGQKPQYQKEKQTKRDKKQEKDKAEKPAPVEVPEEIDPVHEEKKLALAKELQRQFEQEKLDEEKGGSGSQSSGEEEVVALEPEMPKEEHLNEAEWSLRMQEAKELIQAESEDDSNGTANPRGVALWSPRLKCEVGRRCFARRL